LSIALNYQGTLRYNESIKETAVNSTPAMAIGAEKKRNTYNNYSENGQHTNRYQFNFRDRNTDQRNTREHDRGGGRDDYWRRNECEYGRQFSQQPNQNRRNYDSQNYRGQWNREYNDNQWSRSDCGNWRNGENWSNCPPETNAISNLSTPCYVNGMFGQVEMPILVDTGSAVTIIDEEVWRIINFRKEELHKVPFAIRSVTQHTIEIIGQKKIPIRLFKRKYKSLVTYNFTVLVAKNLAHKAIVGLDFLKEFAADINILNGVLTLMKHGTKLEHSLLKQTSGRRNNNLQMAIFAYSLAIQKTNNLQSTDDKETQTDTRREINKDSTHDRTEQTPPQTEITNEQRSENENNNNREVINIPEHNETTQEEVEEIEELNEEENEQNDETYQPDVIIEEQPLRRNPPRERKPLLRYNSTEFVVNNLEIIQKVTNPKQNQQKNTVRSYGIKLWYLFIFCFLMTKCDAVSVVDSQQDLGQLFGPAQMCGSSGHEAMYIALPELPTCDWKDPRSTMVENLLVTPFFGKTFSEAIDAYGCQVEISTIITQMGFFGSKSVLDKSQVYSKVSLELCMEEVRAIKDKTTKLEEISHNVLSNHSKPFPLEFHWCCSSHIIKQYRLIIKKTKIRFNYHNKKVVSSIFPTDKCPVNERYCITPGMTIIWEHTINETCQLEEGSQVPAQRIWNENKFGWTMVSEIGEFVATSTHGQSSLQCGQRIYEVNEGLFIRIDEINSTLKLRQKLNQRWNPIRTTNEVALISFVAHDLETLIYDLFRKTWLNICRLVLQRQLWIEQMATNPQQAYIAARILMKTRNVIAYPAGQFLAAYECETIYSYYLEKKTTCFKSIPIRFKTYDKHHQHYLLPTTKDIIFQDTEISCNKPIRMFMISNNGQNKTIYLWNGTDLYPTKINYTSVQLIEQAPNFTHKHLIASRIIDTASTNFDITTDLASAASNMLMTIAHVTNMDMVSFDPETLHQATSNTISMIKGTVSNVIDHVYPFLHWIHQLFVGIVITLIIIAFAFVIIKCIHYVRHEEATLKLDNLFANIRTTATNQPVLEQTES
jgi:hypothetical protein